MFFLHLLFQSLHDSGGGIHTDISHNEDFFQFFIEIIINIRKASEDQINSPYNVVTGLGQSFF